MLIAPGDSAAMDEGAGYLLCLPKGENAVAEISRRDFMRTAGLAAAGGCGLLLKGCASKAPYDVVIRDGLVVDGLGTPGRVADVGIIGDFISRVGKIPSSRGASVISAKGMVVAPGFIDVHNHTDVNILINPRAESYIRQGVTTIVAGQCGDSPFPLSDVMFEETEKNLRKEYGLALSWRDIRGFYTLIDKAGTALNFSSLVGQGTVRAAAMGYEDRKPEPAELALMKKLVADSMAGGAFGISTGLEYAPGGFSSTEELIEVCRTAAPYKGMYATHMRDEEDFVVEAVDEAIRIARDAGLPLQISHLKTGYARNWPKLGAILERIETARAAGMDVFCDRYPYIAAATGLDIFFPLWAREGTTEGFLRRLRDPSLEDKLKAFVREKEAEMGSWDKVLISDVGTEKNKGLEGMSILEASRKTNKTPYDFMKDLIIEENDRVGMVQFIMSEDNLRTLMAHPLVGIGSDGEALAPYGPLGKGKPHPRAYGAFPRALGKYVREDGLLPVEAMVRKMTSIPAARFGFARRGVLRTGSFADIVVFDPDRIRDKATWADPHQYPDGIPHVLVNGKAVVRDGEHTGDTPGAVLRKCRPDAA
jgi:N-acyl-D-amino-acid deacylase